MEIDVSIVSHQQATLAAQLLEDLRRDPRPESVRLTLNTPEVCPMIPQFAGLSSHVNIRPMGFAANHNAAFEHSQQRFFCVVNPDIRLPTNPFGSLVNCMSDPKVGLVAPMVINPRGELEDSVRHFPTPSQLLNKALGKDDGRYHLPPQPQGKAEPVEWVAGMFMLFRADAFRAIGGFDDKFHLYYEDVDICARLWRAGWKVVVDPQTTVVHDAQRASRHNLKYMAWHASSMARYFYKHYGRLPRVHPPGGLPTPFEN